MDTRTHTQNVGGIDVGARRLPKKEGATGWDYVHTIEDDDLTAAIENPNSQTKLFVNATTFITQSLN